MKQSELQRYARFYTNARHLQVDTLLRRVLGLPADFVVPVNVAHGVDFGFSRAGFDLYKQEPIYWATNPRVAALAGKRKPVFTAPHPFLLAAAGQSIPAGEGTLVIGPPPGPENDRNLLDLIVPGWDPAATSILIKPHAKAAQSAQFWRDAGFSTLSFADAPGTGYEAMVATLARFREVIAGNVSSAVFFAAALGKQIRLLHGYRFRAYEGLHAANFIDYSAAEAQRTVRIMNSSDPAEATACARHVLGGDYDAQPQELRAQLTMLIDRLTLPFFVRHPIPHVAKKLAIACAVRAERPSLLLSSVGEFVRGRLTSDVLIMDINDISLWLDGRKPDNPHFSKTRYIRREREPGMAVVAY